ncbi:MAG: chain-length determining protein [Muribaculaceae bacterium]|nr:chain-length determining protein [Muribaculaceae bacterium]MDE6755150.1 chain-length determining protein [Muribaculaceae bacterium]
MQEEKDKKPQETEEKEIDLLELATKLWDSRKKLIIWSICGAVIGLIIAFSIPKEYSTTVKLAPEANDTKTGGSLGALASMAGLSAGSASGADAFYPQLYPDVVSSVPFITGLFDVEVSTKEGGKKITVREYMEEDIRRPWWSAIMGAPGMIIGALKNSDDEDTGHKLNTFQLTPTESRLVEALNRRIAASVDQKTSVVSIDVQMQDPLVSAILADTVVSRLQAFITDYRTNKARKDLEYAETLNEEAQQEYYKAQQRYADYLDRNQGIVMYSAQITRDRLENEATLAFNLYNQTAQQVQKAKAKVQETTPVYAIVTPATVPVKASSPKKMMILVGFTFLAFVACAAWILFGQPLLAERKKISKKEKENSVKE